MNEPRSVIWFGFAAGFASGGVVVALIMRLLGQG
jgi:hypothetical protein